MNEINNVASSCFHCGLPLPADAQWSVRIADVPRAMCCPGCEAVARSIVDNGLTDYYLNRDGYSTSVAEGGLVPAELQLYDTPEVLGQFAETAASDPDTLEAVYSVEGIRCAACVWLIERRLASVPGIKTINLNVATGRLHVSWRRDACKPSDILGAVREVGYVAYPYDAARHGEHMQRASRTLFRQLFIAGLSMMQVMMYAVPVYMATDGTMDADMEVLMRWASLLLTLPAVVYSALTFYHGAITNLKSRMLGMDVPVALGIVAAFGGSVAATISGEGDVYFDSVTMFIFLLLCSRYLELMARRKAASALEKLQQALPASAACLPAYPSDRSTTTVPAARLREGDVIMVKPGETVPADCVILEGSTALDLSLLTGESRPQRVSANEVVPGGAVNASQAFVARVSKPVLESTLSKLVKLIERAGQGKPQLALWADKVAAWFVAALLLFSVAVFFVWQSIDPSRAWPIAIAVLVVSCPCALSLATPSALAAAVDRLVRQGVLIVQPHVLETLHRATHVVFDKTGTLTTGKPYLQRLQTLDAQSDEDCLQLAAALEVSSAHPLAAAFRDAVAAEGFEAEAVSDNAGQGLEGTVRGMRYRLGTASFVQGITGTPMPQVEEAGVTRVYLGTTGRWLAYFDIADTLRSDAREVMQQLRRAGKEIVLLSGDNQGAVQKVAHELGIEEAWSACRPDTKLEVVQQLQARGAVVAMVGDGINDAAVLRAADVSFAMGSGAALAQTHADAVLLHGRLGAVADAAQAASQTMSVVRQNLAWASVYNIIAIPAAAFGILNPWLAGIGMSLSSAVVVINALRLRRIPRSGRTSISSKAAGVKRAAA